MTWQRYNKNLRKSALLAEYLSFWTNLTVILSSVIDSHLGLRSKLIGYQYSEIIRAVFSVFCCGGDCMEDLNLYLKDVLAERPHTRIPSADTVLRGIEELATENISYTAEKTGNVYDFNTAEKLNQLLIKLLLATGQLAF